MFSVDYLVNEDHHSETSNSEPLNSLFTEITDLFPHYRHHICLFRRELLRMKKGASEPSGDSGGRHTSKKV